MKILVKYILVGSLLLLAFQYLPAWAQDDNPTSGGPAPPRILRRVGHMGRHVWRIHHQQTHDTFRTTDSLGLLTLYAGGVVTNRYPIRIRRDYPYSVRLELQIGTTTRVLLFDGISVRAEQPPAATREEIELALMIATNALEWVFVQIDRGAELRLIHENVRAEDYIPSNPVTFNVHELVFPNQTMLVLSHSMTHLVQKVRYWLNRQDIQIDFRDWRTGLPIHLPHRISYKINGQNRAELVLSTIIITPRS